MKYGIDIHADDYATSMSSNKDIIELCKTGKLDSISVIPNLEIFPQSVDLFLNEAKTFPKKINVSIHIDFVEGKCCAKKEDIPHLVDRHGFFNISWKKLLLWSYNPLLRNTIRNELKTEIIAQTEKMISVGIVNENALRFDSHQHTHMIPIVFDALIDAIREKKYQVEYIRNSEDPIIPYFFHLRIYKYFSLINIIKCIVLNFYALRVRRSFLRMHLVPIYLCGVFFSNNMNEDCVKEMILHLSKKANNSQRILEVLFHPGLVSEEELNEEIMRDGFREFHISQNRCVEYDAAMSLPAH